MVSLAMADADLQIRRTGHPDPEIRGSRSQTNFLALRASVWSKNKGGPGHPGPPLSR